MELSKASYAVKSKCSIVRVYLRVTGHNFLIYCKSLKIDFVLVGNADPDEMLYYVAFHPGLHCLTNHPSNVFCPKRIKLVKSTYLLDSMYTNCA